MKYLQDTTYQNLNSNIKSIKWAIYLPAKHGSNQTSANISLAHNASSILKNYLKKSDYSNKYINKITISLKEYAYQLNRPLRGYSVAIFIYIDGTIEFYDLPFEITEGYATDIENLLLAPIERYGKNTISYYLIDMHSDKTTIYELIQDKLKPITTSASSLNYIDKQITQSLNDNIRPIILMGSRKMAHAFKKASHNRSQIIGYISDIPAKFSIQTLNAKLLSI